MGGFLFASTGLVSSDHEKTYTALNFDMVVVTQWGLIILFSKVPRAADICMTEGSKGPLLNVNQSQ